VRAALVVSADIGTWHRPASLPLEIDGYELGVREFSLSEEFVRYTTIDTLHGGGEGAVSADVVYDGLVQTPSRPPGPRRRLPGRTASSASPEPTIPGPLPARSEAPTICDTRASQR
jgi:hypothetical protein